MASHFKEGVAPTAGEPVRLTKKKRSAGRIISNLLIVVGVVMLGVAAFLWGRQQLAYHKQDEMNRELEEFVTISEDPSVPPVVDWDALKAINADVCAWLQIPGTVINYPVYQGQDNELYLRHDATGEYSVGGQVFIDYECTNPGMVDGQTIAYGHHLLNGAMFKQIADTENQEFFDSIKTVWYVTEQDNFELEPLLTYYTNPNDENVRHFVFADEAELHTYLSKLLDASVTHSADASTVITKATRVLTLSTCNYIDGYGRTLMVCALKSEAAEARGGATS